MKLAFRRLVGLLSAIIAPSYSGCQRCRMSWRFTDIAGNALPITAILGGLGKG